MNDYKKIKIQHNMTMSEEVNLTTNDTNKWFEEQLQFIERQLDIVKKQENKRAIVVTHHAPLTKGVSDPKYENSTNEWTRQLNMAFGTDLSHLMGPPVIAWFFGHTHFSSRQCCRNTIVASNQLGYLFGNLDQTNELFDGFWILDTNQMDYSKFKEVNLQKSMEPTTMDAVASTNSNSNHNHKKKCLCM